jgi:hypothetical protein
VKSHSLRRHRLGLAIPAALFTFVLLFSLTLLSEDDGPPRCPASRTGTVDIVTTGPRPCILHAPAGVSSGAVPGPDAGHATVPGRSGKTTAPGKSGGVGKQPKTPAAPKAPAAPAPKAPAPAPKAPSFSKR